ncbi:MAG: sensor domain-containing diguanylate cyclase [Denitrovibrio sp.]|nr:MAG: sensor domain-containing diguanylate cyclase [Denitrovibrio sp.]
MDKEYKRILDYINIGIYYVDSNMKITFWNKSAEKISGFTAEEVTGKCCADNILRHVDEKGTELCIYGCPLGATLKDGKEREAKVYLHHKDGHRVPVSVGVTAIYNDNRDIIGAVEIFTDVTSSLDLIKEMEKLKEEVFTDALTQVGNRKYADNILEQRLSDWNTFKAPFSLYFIDADHFKNVNDTYGHTAGDSVLKMIARSIMAAMRPFDSVCRWGGEEFIVVVPNIDSNNVEPIGERIRMLIESSWLDYEGEKIRVTASIGCSTVTDVDTVEDIIQRADRAMYQSKENGRNMMTII